MPTIAQLLKALNTKEAAAPTTDLADELDTSNKQILVQLKREKEKGNVEGSSEEGWKITEAGKKALEKLAPSTTMISEGVTPREKFESIARRIGITDERIGIATDIVWSGNYEDIIWVWEALRQADIRNDLAKIWVNSWRAFLHKGIPPELEAELAESAKKEGVEADRGTGEKVDSGRSYILVDDIPTFVGKGLGDLYYQDAVDLARIRAARGAHIIPAASGGGGVQQWGPTELTAFINEVDKMRGGGAGPKIYAVTQGEQGAVMKEVQPGELLNLGSLGSGKPQPLYIIDNEGYVQELKPGLRIAGKASGDNPPKQKLTLVRTDKDGKIVKEEHEAGDVVILGGETRGGGTGMGIPFPVFDETGRPVVDQEGKPVYANLESTLAVLGWRGEQQRAQEKHEAIIGLVQTAREKLGDGIEALREAAAEVKAGRGEKAAGPQVYRCGTEGCGAEFTLPATEDWKIAVCPKCKTQYTREQVMSV